MTDEELIMRRLANPGLFREQPGADSPRALTERALAASGLPWADEDDLADPEVPRAALASPEAWQEWLCAPSGRSVWLKSPGDLRLAPETNFMARSVTGDEAGGYVKIAELVNGLDVWRRQ